MKSVPIQCPDTGRFQRGEVTLADFHSENPAFQRVLERAEAMAGLPKAVLLHGPSGSGKTFFAQGIHRASLRARGPFVVAVLAGLPEHLAYAEMFGFAKGAFTGADHTSPGYVGRAEGGTLFIDEVGDYTPEMQKLLLRLINERMYVPFGGEQKAADVRLVLATHRDLEAMVRAGQFREDLWFRIKGLVIELPPLREHREDVERLLFGFLVNLGRADLAKREAFDDAAWEYVMTHHFHANLRDLRDIATRASLASRGRKVTREDILLESTGDPSAPQPGRPVWEVDSLVTLDEMMRRYVCWALQLTDWNVAEASRRLLVSPSTIRKYMPPRPEA